MNYSMNDLNAYIAAEKSRRLPADGFVTVGTLDFCNATVDELLATIEACKYVETPRRSPSRALSFFEFKRLFEEGLIDIALLTGRQKMLFLTCLSDHECTAKMMIASAACEEDYFKYRKALPYAVRVLNPETYSMDQVKLSSDIARWFMECNQRVLNYHRYSCFVKSVLGEELC